MSSTISSYNSTSVYFQTSVFTDLLFRNYGNYGRYQNYGVCEVMAVMASWKSWRLWQLWHPDSYGSHGNYGVLFTSLSDGSLQNSCVRPALKVYSWVLGSILVLSSATIFGLPPEQQLVDVLSVTALLGLLLRHLRATDC